MSNRVDLMLPLGVLADEGVTLQSVIDKVAKLGYNDCHGGYADLLLESPKWQFLCVELSGYDRQRDICLSARAYSDDIVVTSVEELIEKASKNAKGGEA